MTRLIRFHIRLVLDELALTPIREHQGAVLPQAERDRIRHRLREYQTACAAALRELDATLSPETARITVGAAFGALNSVPLNEGALPRRTVEQLATDLAWRLLGQSREA